MNRRAWLRRVAAAVLFPRISLSAVTSSETRESTVQLGDTTVRLAITELRPPGCTFLSIHENEKTAVAAAHRVIRRFGGRLIEFKGRGGRLVRFTLHQKDYTFDPNRIFTDTGIQKTLRLHGAYSKAAHSTVAQLREALLASIGKSLKPPVIALHNNSDGAFSVKSYLAGGPLQHEASRVSVNGKIDPDNFFLVTEANAYDRLKGAGFNVVLQSPNPTDDGSMSVYCQQNKIGYVNVEAEFGHFNEQHRMLEVLHNLLSHSPKGAR